jgi:hypothetical protein
MVARKCKRSRRNKKQSRRNRRQSRRQNRNQRGGMAPFDAPYQSMSDSAARAMAGVANLDSSIAELPSVIPRHQSGGAELAPFRGGRRLRLRKSRRNQRGGMSPIDAPSVYIRSPAGVNPQFANEGSVNSLYSASRGAQGY